MTKGRFAEIAKEFRFPEKIIEDMWNSRNGDEEIEENSLRVSLLLIAQISGLWNVT